MANTPRTPRRPEASEAAAARDAKRAAVERYLAAPSPVSGYAAYAVAVAPHENVVGVGLGTKIVGGKPTARACVRFCVAR